MKIIDSTTWNRKEHFEFFSKMASPYVGITTEVDCTIAFEKTKAEGYSFFAYYLHKSMMAVNDVPELKLRLIDNQVAEFETIHAGSTIGREDGTFGFIFVNYSPDFTVFNSELQQEIEAVQNSTGLRLNNDDIQKNLIRHSTFPWHNFSALLHPTNFDSTESVPKITFGGYSQRNDRKYLPVSIEAHHGLVDGLHIANYLKAFQDYLNG